MIGLITAAAVLLAVAGAGKLSQRRPARSVLQTAGLPGAELSPRLVLRTTGVAELGIAAAAVVVGGRWGAVLLAATFAVLAGMSLRLMSVAAGADCGCFNAPAAMTHWHTGVNLGFTGIGLVAVVLPPPALLPQLSHQPGTVVVTVLAAAGLAYASYLLMTALPDLLTASRLGATS